MKEFTQKLTDPAAATALGEYRQLAPADSKSFPGLHVYYIHQFSVNGVYLGGTTCFVRETAKLRPVEGGIDEPLPRVTSHELGHSLGLPHRQNVTNLRASGNNGTKLNEAETAIARAKAGKLEGVMTMEQCEKTAKEDEALKKELDGLGN